MMVALASPPPSHMVWSPKRPLVRSSSLSSVAISLPPEAPSGWPRAMAPPLGFTSSMFGWCSFSHASTTEAKASLISTASMSSSVNLARSSTVVVAGIGPVSIVTGSTPARAKAWKRARGRRPSAFAFSSLITSTADAPSVICEEFPAVVVVHRHRHDLVLEAALRGGRRCSPVAPHRVGVELLARDAPLIRDHLGPDALALQPAVPVLGVAGHHARAEGEAVLAHDRRAHGGVGHGLDAGRDRNVVGPGHHALGGEVQRLLGGAALAVDGRGGNRAGPPSGQPPVAA